MNKNVSIFDTTLRDGEQVPGCQLTTDEKISIALELEALGVDIVEAGFPVSSPGDFKSVNEISKVLVMPVICAVHILNKFNSNRQEILERAIWAVGYAKRFVEDIEFYAEDAGRADLPFLARMIEAVIRAGATVVNIPDTNGYCTPDQYGYMIKYLNENVKNIDKATISAHCHNDLGLATANSLAGVINGARQVECTVNGIGERAGNTSLEEIAMVLKTHPALGFKTGVRHERIYPISRLVSEMMHMPVQPNKAIVGSNAFAHSSGIHQDGFLKHRENYEIMDPADVGFPEASIVLTARSGRHALKHRLEILGYSFDKKELDVLYTSFLHLADQKKAVIDEDLEALANHFQES